MGELARLMSEREAAACPMSKDGQQEARSERIGNAHKTAVSTEITGTPTLTLIRWPARFALYQIPPARGCPELEACRRALGRVRALCRQRSPTNRMVTGLNEF